MQKTWSALWGWKRKKHWMKITKSRMKTQKQSPSKSMDYLTVPNQHQNNTPHQKKKLIRHDSLNVDDAPVKVESSSKDFLSVPSHLHPNDTLAHQKKNSRNTDSNEDLTGNTEADIEDTFLEIPSTPFEVDSNTHVEVVGKGRAPMEDLVKQLTEDPEDDENDINLDRDIQGKKNTLQTRQIKSNSLRMPEKDRRAKLDVFSTEDRSPVLKRRNSDTSRRKKGKESKVVQFVEDEPELIDSRKSSLKLKNKEKTSTKRGEIEPGLEKLKLLEEIQQLREEKLHEVERRKELENTLESMKNWETTQRLQKVLDEKKKKQAREAEKLRQEMFESNRKRRQGLEKELLLKVSRNRKERERMIRYQRQKQEQEEMLREGAMSNFVQSMLHMWRPHLSPRSSVKEQDSVEVQEPEKGINLTEHIEDHLYSRIYKSSSSSTLPSDRSQGKTKQKKRKDKLLSRKSASFDLSTPSYDLELYERSIDLHPDLNVSSQIDDDLLNSYDLAQSGHPSNNVVTTTVCV
ncbi:trichohyalin-like [Saccostrea cucullata]|uniref:trichohyalin-like n=1 Tax=Saccostrea cuccullata TaxID=36930 RepID=UPI002ED551E9